MLRKITDNIGYAGFLFLFTSFFYYSVFKQWDWKFEIAFYGGVGLILIYIATNFSRLRASLKTRVVQYGAAAGLMTLLVLGILVLTNFLNFRHHKRVDLTEQQMYSLSEQTHKVIGNLEVDVEIVGFTSTLTSSLVVNPCVDAVETVTRFLEISPVITE